MPPANANPYSAPQVRSEKRTSVWLRLIYRGGIGLLVGALIYGTVQSRISSEKNIIGGLFLLSLCAIVAGSSTFTQSETAKKNGRTGIIAAILLCLASAVIAYFLTHALIETPPHLKGYEAEWAQYQQHHQNQSLLVWIFLFAVLVCGYFFLFCRQQVPAIDSNDSLEPLP